MNDFFYRKIQAYQEALIQVKNVYALTNRFPASETHCLTSQIRRAVISIPSNIAEGMGRNSIKERIHFLEIANGSITETMCQLEIAHMLTYISDEELRICEEKMILVSRLLSGLKRSLEEKLNKQQY
ncbi:MAG: four helix bundle protein [Prevotella sp.]|nr:four helix bundle protein [Prevotella sp.]